MITSVAPRRRTLPTVLAAAAVALAALLFPAPAFAHDELVSSDPAADAILDALPPQITLTYSADILDADGATVIQVTDAAGTSLTDGAPTVSGTVVTQALAGSASGAVTVVWRVVSGDGHPIDGTFAFSVPTAPTPTATPTSTPTATPSAASTPEPTVTVTETSAPAESTSDASPLPWIVLAVALLLVVGAVVWLFLARGRRGSSGSGSAGTAGR